MAGRIFVNYRRGDDPGFTHALYQHLEREFTTSQVFMDVQGHIKPGDDFIDVLNTQVAAADIVLVVVGPRWVELMAAHRSASEDFVAIEINAALEARKRVIPVLVGVAKMPAVDALPETIRALARRNAVELRPERFRADCQELVIAIKDQLAALDASRAEHEQRAAAEVERQARETEEAARAQRAKEQQLERERTASRERQEEPARAEPSKETGDDDAQVQLAARLGRQATAPDILPFRVPRAAAATLGVGVLSAIGGAIAGAALESATVNVFGKTVLYSQALTAGVVTGVALLLVARVKPLTSALIAIASGMGWFVSEILLVSATSPEQGLSPATLFLWGIGNWSSPGLALALLNPGGKSRAMWLVVVIAGGVVGLIYQQPSTFSLVTSGAIFLGVPMACIGYLLNQRVLRD
jgi:hypothetical protein